MTPLEANAEARVALSNAKWNGEKARIEADVLECLLATAEREAKLREALQWYVDNDDTNDDGTNDYYIAHKQYAEAVLLECLESKGGGT